MDKMRLTLLKTESESKSLCPARQGVLQNNRTGSPPEQASLLEEKSH